MPVGVTKADGVGTALPDTLGVWGGVLVGEVVVLADGEDVAVVLADGVGEAVGVAMATL